jgi:two-component system phosphate regulon sensor histidine kinase PhoR
VTGRGYGALGAVVAASAALILAHAGVDLAIALVAAAASGSLAVWSLDLLRQRLAARSRIARNPNAAVSKAANPLAEESGRALLELLPLGLILLDRRGDILFANIAAEELMERSLTGLPAGAALRAPSLRDAIDAATARRRDSEIDVTIQRSKERIVHVYVRALRSAAASQTAAPAVMVLLDDRTSQARAEALRRDFVANASHELKTPLASIAGFIETLQGHAKDDPEAAERFLRIMAAQADRMKRLVEDLISLNRIEMNEHVAPRTPVDVSEVVWEVAGALAPVAEAERTRIEVDLPEQGVRSRGDAGEITQVFVNLIENAIKYAGRDGPIRVYAEAPAPARPGMIGVTVADSGPGIAREHLPRLTERFYRVDVSGSRERGGTGLGLAIAKHILNRHRGDLTVASVVGQGARFTVWLPRPEAARARAAAE